MLCRSAIVNSCNMKKNSLCTIYRKCIVLWQAIKHLIIQREFHPAAWKSPKSSSTLSWSFFSVGDDISLDGEFTTGWKLASSVAGARGELVGDLWTGLLGETGVDGGGGGLKENLASFVFALSCRERLFRPCSKNADLASLSFFCVDWNRRR